MVLVGKLKGQLGLDLGDTEIHFTFLVDKVDQTDLKNKTKP